MKRIKMKIWNKSKIMRHFARDAHNRLLYGRHAPLTAQLVFIDPSNIQFVYYGNLWDEELPEPLQKNKSIHAPLLGSRSASGKVVGGDWDKDIIPLNQCPKYLVCQKRFIGGMSWEDTGGYEMMRQILIKKPGADGCHTMADVIKRFENVDNLYQYVKK